MYQCQTCRKIVLSEKSRFYHCHNVLEWKGDNIMLGKKVKIAVSGYVEMTEGALDNVLESYKENLHMGLLYSLHMGYCDATALEFDVPDRPEEKPKTQAKPQNKAVVQGKTKGESKNHGKWAWEK